MSTIQYQFRYTTDGSTNNNPSGLTKDSIVIPRTDEDNGNAFFNKFDKITQIYINAPEGSEFYLNDSRSPILVESNKLFVLNLTDDDTSYIDDCCITNLWFSPETIDMIERLGSSLFVNITGTAKA